MKVCEKNVWYYTTQMSIESSIDSLERFIPVGFNISSMTV